MSVGSIKYLEIGRVFTRIFVLQESFPSSLGVRQNDVRIMTSEKKIKDDFSKNIFCLCTKYTAELNLKKFKSVEITNSNLNQYYSSMVQYLEIIKEKKRAVVIMQEEYNDSSFETVRPAFLD